MRPCGRAFAMSTTGPKSAPSFGRFGRREITFEDTQSRDQCHFRSCLLKVNLLEKLLKKICPTPDVFIQTLSALISQLHHTSLLPGSTILHPSITFSRRRGRVRGIHRPLRSVDPPRGDPGGQGVVPRRRGGGKTRRQETSIGEKVAGKKNNVKVWGLGATSNFLFWCFLGGFLSHDW